MRLVWHFWQSECRALPENADRIYILAGAHKPTWAIHKAEIMRIFNESAPALARELKVRQNKLGTLAELRERGVAARRKRRLEKKLAAPTAIEAPAPRRDQAAKRVGKGFTEKIAA